MSDPQSRDPRPDAIKRLTAAGVDNPRLDVRVLWAAAGGDVARFQSFIARRETSEPVAYITGHREFWSLDFVVGPGVLIPRPDTETMIEAVLKAFPDKSASLNVLDLGTGSGCILAAVLSEYPNATGLGIDAAEEPLRIAAANTARFGTRAEIRSGNWDANLDDAYDIVLSNPPYIPTGDIATLAPDVRQFEPHAALDGGTDGLDAVRALAPALKRLLKTPFGMGFVEIGIGQGEQASTIFAAAGLVVKTVAEDLSGVPRIVIVHK